MIDFSSSLLFSLFFFFLVPRYKQGVSASLSCTSSSSSSQKTSLGFLHVYGNTRRGPYLHGHVDDAQDPYTSTPRRVCKGLRVWEEAHGAPPGEVVWSVVWWDESFIMRQTEMKEDDEKEEEEEEDVRKKRDARMVSRFRKHYVARLADLDECRRDKTSVALTTIPRSSVSASRLLLLNEEIRKIGTERGLFVYVLVFPTSPPSLVLGTDKHNCFSSLFFFVLLCSSFSSSFFVAGTTGTTWCGEVAWSIRCARKHCFAMILTLLHPCL